MRSYDPATGKLLWELSGVNGRCSATPVGTDELLYVGVGGGRGGSGPLVAIRADAEGELDVFDKDASPGIAWSTPRAGPPMASPLVYDGLVYVLEQRGGIIGCYDAKTGEEKYHERIEGASGFTASPWSHSGKIYCLDETGNTFVLAPRAELKVEATNKLNDQFWSSAAIAGNNLLLRGVEYLYSIAPK
jgi:outer membrane protein assembly factor BamB